MTEDPELTRMFAEQGEVVVRPHRFDAVVAAGLEGQFEIYSTLVGDADCAFLANTTFNALAISKGTRYAIGINVGALVLIARYCYCLMSDPAMLRRIGDPGREQVEPYVIGALRAQVNDALLYGRYLPRDPIRKAAAEQLAIAAYLALFFHELNHIELGHLGFLQKRHGMTAYREFSALPISPEQAAVRRALEWEADTAALYRSLKVWCALYSLFDIPALSTVLSAEESWFIAVELLFWIMDFVHPALRGDQSATHPSPVARRVNLYEVTAAASWATTKDEASSPLLPWVERNAFASRAPADPSVDDTDRARSELKEMARQLAAMLPRLESHRRLRTHTDP